MFGNVNNQDGQNSQSSRKKTAKKTTTRAKTPYQIAMKKELAKLKTKYGFKTGATDNKKSWQVIFREAAHNCSS